MYVLNNQPYMYILYIHFFLTVKLLGMGQNLGPRGPHISSINHVSIGYPILIHTHI